MLKLRILKDSFNNKVRLCHVLSRVSCHFEVISRFDKSHKVFFNFFRFFLSAFYYPPTAICHPPSSGPHFTGPPIFWSILFCTRMLSSLYLIYHPVPILQTPDCFFLSAIRHPPSAIVYALCRHPHSRLLADFFSCLICSPTPF